MLTSKMSEEQEKWLNKVRHEWFAKIKPFNGFGIDGDVFTPLLLPAQHQLEGAQLFADRYAMITHLIGQNTVGAEVGVQEGYFSKFIINNIKPSEFHLFDLDFSPLFNANSEVANHPCVKIHLGNSSEAMQGLPSSHFDWIYIDGDHSYEGCKADINAAMQIIKPGGILIFNDYVLWSIAECIDYGVPYAVGELLHEHNAVVSGIALHPYFHNDVAIRLLLSS
jgi:hypothetical protein